MTPIRHQTALPSGCIPLLLYRTYGEYMRLLFMTLPSYQIVFNKVSTHKVTSTKHPTQHVPPLRHQRPIVLTSALWISHLPELLKGPPRSARAHLPGDPHSRLPLRLPHHPSMTALVRAAFLLLLQISILRVLLFGDENRNTTPKKACLVPMLKSRLVTSRQRNVPMPLQL